MMSKIMIASALMAALVSSRLVIYGPSELKEKFAFNGKTKDI